MGMYDNVDYECVCPVCHSKVSRFQSESGDCVLDTLKPKNVDNFYSPCEKCGCWIEFSRQNDGSYMREVTGKNWKKLPHLSREVWLKE